MIGVLIVPILKNKGSDKDPENYRGIILLVVYFNIES